MTVRANSIQILMLDSLYFAALLGLFAATMTAFAQGTTPASERVGDIATDRRLTDDHVDSQLNTDDNMPDGNPAETAESKREAMMFGMKLVERSEGDIRIADVAATSPAWDAGIRRGDRLLSIATLKPQALSPWVEDVSKVLKETPDGQSIPAEIMRGDEKLSLRIRLAVSRAAAVRDARQEERALANMAAGDQMQQMQPGQTGTQVVPGGGESGAYGPGYGGSGSGGLAIGGFFDDETGSRSGDDRMANSAVAQLMAVSTLSGGTANQSQATQGSSAQSGGGQVGIAAFQNNGQGVNAIVAVRGLPQGSYRVGIGQGDALTGGSGAADFGAGTPGNEQFRSDPRDRLGNGNQLQNDPRRRDRRPLQDQQLQPGDVRSEAQQVPGQGNQQVPLLPQQPNPANSPAGAAAPSGDGASLANPRGSVVLAQQLDPGQSQSGQDAARSQAHVPNERVPNENGLIDPRQNNPRGIANGNRNGTNLPQAGENLHNGMGNMASTPFVAEIGVLQVGPDGSGRVQNQLEGLAVRNLAGMSVTVVSANGVAGNQRGNQNVDARSNNEQLAGSIPQNNRGAGASGGQNAAGQNAAGTGVVATGVIRLIEGENLPNLGQQRGGSSNQEQPVDEETLKQRRRSQISDPRNDFNPSN